MSKEFDEGIGNEFDAPIPGQSLTDTPGMAKRSNMMGMQGKVVDADTLNRLWLARLREYQKYTKFYT